MPYQRPDDEDVITLAAELGIKLTKTEARLFRVRLHEHVEALEAFHELRIEEERPPLGHLHRDPGYRPGADEDPLNVFIRRCRVEGAPDGPSGQERRTQGPHRARRRSAHLRFALHGRLRPGIRRHHRDPASRRGGNESSGR